MAPRVLVLERLGSIRDAFAFVHMIFLAKEGRLIADGWPGRTGRARRR